MEKFLGIILWADHRITKRLGNIASLEEGVNYVFYFNKVNLDFKPQPYSMVWFTVEWNEDKPRVTSVELVNADETISREDVETLQKRQQEYRKAHDAKRYPNPIVEKDVQHKTNLLHRSSQAREEQFKKTGIRVYKNRFED